jgi:hypothetical protein
MPQRDPAKEEYWRRLLRQWRQSGLTPREFCVEERITEPSFYAWRREIARRDQQAAKRRKRQSPSNTTPAFIKLAIDDDVPMLPMIEVVLSERRLLRVRPGFDVDLLRQLVHVLEEPSC